MLDAETRRDAVFSRTSRRARATARSCSFVSVDKRSLGVSGVSYIVRIIRKRR